MQPSITLYSGELGLKFCSEECKELWFPSADQKFLHVASYLDEACQLEDTATPALTIISRKENAVAQIFLFMSESLENVKRPYIVWHVRESECQFFAHFYISRDCLPLNSVWVKQISSGESKTISNLIANQRKELQASLLKEFNEAVKICGFENFEAFLIKLNGTSIQNGKKLPAFA